ncbi:unnamed protein product [Rotaria sp. Silwood1]|nr:unnamed protein product [Rotaria sp. Silwood1]CAF1686257.1 unnamed protein product [Rotaria sp. Silwood1]
MQYYQKITHYFSGELFLYVRLLSLYGEHSFEYEILIRISQSFPLSFIINHKKHKQLYNSINHNENSSSVKYNYLITVDISKVHDDYKEEFLFNTKTYFHTNILLYIND